MKMNNPFQSYNRGYTARERRIRTKYASLFLVTGLACIWLSVKSYDDSKELEEQRGINTQLQTQTVKMQNQIDSLKKECSDKDSLLTKRGITALINQRDSLRSELFVASTVIGRYDVALELLREEDRKAANKFELILSTKTE